ncbi:peptidoglycan DD-metalloendopeptidase family protein [Marinobacter confluentis]|uniref:LysM peptidoglycan-binding domain-containing protein n=1 Tax=Marinobacter confluentis TaxID=1697557 RepID=A0A4Z1BPN4_9GAMM|nr:peptidoglycan DD-metalloendopeptidase family protein [Marinobacter confluentis]TGN41957.1 LysM peptidoglycan-binding domain-containing protein [Marinobacter confluentis]
MLTIMAFGLVGCNTPAIHQDDRYNPPVYWGRHVVKSGETLYSIAWRYGRDYRELGDANGIDPPYNLKAGQVLRLDQRGSVTAASGSPKPPSPTRTSSPPDPPAPKVSKPPNPSAPPAEQSQTVASIEWRWPHVGTVIARYSTSGKVNKGIDIAGNPGDSVRAAASGNVVYAGDGLLGYGNLVIVNHNEHYLSAYAHNRKVVVREGDNVKAGQKIAELGSSGTDRPKLHFEIRKNGNPVNPVPYLPPR